MATKKNQTPQSDTILADEYIEIISLTPYQLNLSTEPKGKGRTLKFEKFGDSRRASYSQLVGIIETNQKFLEDGNFYILDERVIKKHGLSYLYENILTKEKLERAFSLKPETVEIYQSAGETQRSFINQTILKKLIANEPVDLNMVSQIEKIGGVNLIQAANEAKEMMAVEK